MQEQEQVFLSVFDKRLRPPGSVAGANTADRHRASLDAVDNKTASAENNHNTIQDLFCTLLHVLMTGKVRVGEMTMSAEKIMK